MVVCQFNQWLNLGMWQNSAAQDINKFVCNSVHLDDEWKGLCNICGSLICNTIQNIKHCVYWGINMLIFLTSFEI